MDATGANILLDVLESEGCEYVFGNPGTTELPLIDALVDRPNLHYVLGLQEASVVAMADGYAPGIRETRFRQSAHRRRTRSRHGQPVKRVHVGHTSGGYRRPARLATRDHRSLAARRSRLNRAPRV